MGALWRASGEAQREHMPVAVFFGESPAIGPDAVVYRADGAGGWKTASLPPAGKLEIWTVMPSGNPTLGSRSPYTLPYTSSPASSIPWAYQMRDLTPAGGISLPDGVRVLFGKLEAGWPTVAGSVVLTQRCYRKAPDGEAKRHEAVFHSSGSTASFDWSQNCYNYACVFDETGEHVIIKIGDPWKRARPRIYGYNLLKAVGWPPKKFTDLAQLPGMLDAYPDNPN